MIPLSNQKNSYDKMKSLLLNSMKPYSKHQEEKKVEENPVLNEVPNETVEDAIVAEGAVGNIPIAIKESILIECQNKTYYYHLGEVLRKKWNTHELFYAPPPPSPSPSEEKKEEANDTLDKTKPFKPRYFFWNGGGEDPDGGMEKEKETEIGTMEPVTRIDQKKANSVTLRFCFFTVDTKAIVPFLKFWMTENKETGMYSFPESMFTPSMDTEEEDEEHAEFLDACRKKFVDLGFFSSPDNSNDEEFDEMFTTERMERHFHGYLMEPDNTPSSDATEDKIVYVFYEIEPPEGAVGIYVILDEIVNLRQILGKPVEPSLSRMFYRHPELLYIYGSAVNPMDEYLYGTDESSSSNQERTHTDAPQEIPYCLYLCRDKKPFSEDVEEGKAVETVSGKLLGVEEEHYMSPKDKYSVAKKGEDTNTSLRTEDEYGFFFYFTNEPIETEDKENAQRYAVFMYNTDYRLDTNTMEILKSLNLDKRLSGGSHWKKDFSFQDWKGGDVVMLQKIEIKENGAVDDSSYSSDVDSIADSDEEIPEPQNPPKLVVENAVENIPIATQPESEPEEEEQEKMEVSSTGEDLALEESDEIVYSSIYFQRDGVPLWCVKNQICFTPLK
jgi:hypothetical protein